MKPSGPVRRLLEDGKYSLAPTEQDEAHESHQHMVRKQQRQRRKDRKKDEKKLTQS